MEYHSEGRNMGVAGKALKADWLFRDTSTAAREASHMVFLLVMLAIGRQSKGRSNVVSPVLPKEAPRAQSPARRSPQFCETMIKPSTHHRVVIASRRDDWP